MMRNWIAVALLSASWMWGLEYYTPANGWLWSIALITAVLLLAEIPRRLACRVDVMIAMVLATPALWMLPWPYRAIPLGLVLGLLPFAIGDAPRFICATGWGTVRAAVILAAQAIALQVYSLLTARCHDLPWPGPSLVAMIARLLGAKASADGADVVIFSTSGPQRLGATWQFAFDPVTLGILVGSVVLVTLWAWEDRRPTESSNGGHSIHGWLEKAGPVFLAIALWVPIRMGLLLGLFLHREMRAPEGLKLTVMNQFFSPWVLGVVSLGAVVSLAFWVRRREAGVQPPEQGQPSQTAGLRQGVLAAIALVAMAGAATTLLVVDPVGSCSSNATPSGNPRIGPMTPIPSATIRRTATRPSMITAGSTSKWLDCRTTRPSTRLGLPLATCWSSRHRPNPIPLPKLRPF
jgi:hypothetical protein